MAQKQGHLGVIVKHDDELREHNLVSACEQFLGAVRGSSSSHSRRPVTYLRPAGSSVRQAANRIGMGAQFSSWRCRETVKGHGSGRHRRHAGPALACMRGQATDILIFIDFTLDLLPIVFFGAFTGLHGSQQPLGSTARRTHTPV